MIARGAMFSIDYPHEITLFGIDAAGAVRADRRGWTRRSNTRCWRATLCRSLACMTMRRRTASRASARRWLSADRRVVVGRLPLSFDATGVLARRRSRVLFAGVRASFHCS